MYVKKNKKKEQVNKRIKEKLGKITKNNNSNKQANNKTKND